VERGEKPQPGTWRECSTWRRQASRGIKGPGRALAVYVSLVVL